MKANDTLLAKELCELWTDGACKGNPGGQGGAGVILKLNDEEIIQKGYYLGPNMNSNECEYEALVRGLELAIQSGVKYLKIRLDSELTYKQVHGLVACRADNLVPLREQVWKLMGEFTEVELLHVRRELNAGADHLANTAILRRGDLATRRSSTSGPPSSLKPSQSELRAV